MLATSNVTSVIPPGCWKAPTASGPTTTVTAAIASARRLTILTGCCTAPNMIESMRDFKSPPRTPETKKGRFAISVLRRTLDAFDDQHFDLAFCRLQLESKLFLQRRQQ